MQFDFKQILNIPDLIILAFLLFQIGFGFYKGFLYTLCSFIGNFIAFAASIFTAKWAAPIVAEIIVSPIIGSVFEKQAMLYQNNVLAQFVQKSITDLATGMAESIAFIGLFVLLSILIGWLVHFLSKSIRFIAHLTPLGPLDSLAGGALGLATGLVLVSLILIGISWFYPITYTPLGYLSPERVEHTVILVHLLDILPIVL